MDHIKMDPFVLESWDGRTDFLVVVEYHEYAQPQSKASSHVYVFS